MLADLTYSRTSCTIELRIVSLIVLDVRFLFLRGQKKNLSGISDFCCFYKKIRNIGKTESKRG